MLLLPSRVGHAVAGHRQSAAIRKSRRSSAWYLTQRLDRGFSTTSTRWAAASVIELSLTTLRD